VLVQWLLVQEAFFSAYRNLESFRGGNVRSWLGRIAVNAAMEFFPSLLQKSGWTGAVGPPARS